MADQNTTPNGTAPATADTAHGQPASNGSGVPQGKRFVDEAEYATLVRNSERLKGQDETIRAFREAGFEKPEEAKRWGGFVKTAKERNLDPDILSKAFIGNQKDIERDDDEPKLDAKALKAELLTEFRTEQAWEKHNEAESKEDAAVQSAVEEVFGKDTEGLDDLVSIVYGKIKPSVRELYPVNHPLHKAAYMPISEKLAKDIAKEVKKARDEKAAARLAEKGDKARKPASTPNRTSAGNPSSSGAPDKTKGGGTAAELRAQAEAFLQARLATRNR